MPKPKGESLTSIAYKTLRADILACRLRPGEKLNISELVKDIGCSLGAVREALSRLRSEGLVIAETNKGYGVAPITQAELEDLTRTRILIEGECLRSAIRRGDLKWESGIVSTLFELSRIDLQDPVDKGRINDAWTETHKRFHEALVAACDSPSLARIRENLYAQSERYRNVSAMRNHLSSTTRILINANVVAGTTA